MPHLPSEVDTHGWSPWCLSIPKVRGPLARSARGYLPSEQGEREGEAPKALPLEGATQAPTIRTCRLRPAIVLLALLWVCFGCASSPATRPELVWPQPPEEPKIQFVKSVSSEADVEKPSIVRWLGALLFGKEPKAGLAKPYAVHADREERLLVADSAWGKILVFDFKNNRFFIIGVDGPGILKQSQGVTTDSAQRIYVTDVLEKRGVVYDRNGKFLFAIGEQGRFERPVGIALNEELKRIYITDTRKHNISVFDMQDGKFLFEFGGRGTEEGKFNFPINLAVDKNGKVYVMDMFNFRVQIFDADGKFRSKFGSAGDGLGQFSKPKGIGVDSEGHIYVVDAAFNNVQIFDQEGRLLLFFGEFGNRSGQFWLPAGMDIDAHDRIYVADQYNKRINIYQYLGERYKKERQAQEKTAKVQ